MTKNNSNVFPVDFDPVEEIIEHASQWALWCKSPSVVTTLEHAIDQFDAFEVPLTIEAIDRIMDSFFGTPQFAAADHESVLPSEFSILYPGVTSQLLSWYVTLAKD